MALTKAIIYGKEHRKQYIGGKAIAKSCRNHGGCPWCLSNRTYKYQKNLQKAIDKQKETW